MAGRPPGDSADGRQRLLDACWSLLLENEPGERITIAAVCERAHCTPPTLYHHFGDLPSLEEAASGRAFEEWARGLAEQIAEVKDPLERLKRHGRAYVEWAIDHPDAYHVLFSQPGKLGADGSGPNFPDLLNTLSEIHDRPTDDPGLYAMGFAFWASIHGLATLSISAPTYPQEVRETTLDYLEDAFNAFGPPEGQSWAADLMGPRAEVEQEKRRPRRPRF